MPTFRDTRTGNLIEAHSRARTVFFRQQDRYIEVTAAPLVDAEEQDQQEYEWWREWTFEVPEGTVAEVLDWAGDDPHRRQAALEAERAGKNRKTVIEALT